MQTTPTSNKCFMNLSHLRNNKFNGFFLSEWHWPEGIIPIMYYINSKQKRRRFHLLLLNNFYITTGCRLHIKHTNIHNTYVCFSFEFVFVLLLFCIINYSIFCWPVVGWLYVVLILPQLFTAILLHQINLHET